MSGLHISYRYHSLLPSPDQHQRVTHPSQEQERRTILFGLILRDQVVCVGLFMSAASLSCKYWSWRLAYANESPAHVPQCPSSLRLMSLFSSLRFNRPLLRKKIMAADL